MYRPPELYDPPFNADIDERTDIWVTACLASFFSSRLLERLKLTTRRVHSRCTSRAWHQSLGCTLYEMAYGKNPFEEAYTHQGASIKLSAMSGRIDFPRDGYSCAL